MQKSYIHDQFILINLIQKDIYDQLIFSYCIINKYKVIKCKKRDQFILNHLLQKVICMINL